ncbi:MFS transporter [Brevibacillus reuszeri]|uniref:MFS transporter n=1 Tax=Brevibacillus reuszeri TaxID=54915 RepID=UPI003670D12A
MTVPRSFNNPLFFIALGLFGVYTIEFGVVGILPVIMEHYQVTASMAGTLVGIFALVIAVLGPFMVLLLSQYNRKKILMISLFIFTASSLLSAYAPSFSILLALRIIPAMFHPVYFSLAFVAAKSLYPENKATQVAAKAFVGTSMGMVLGVPITAYIAVQFSMEAAFLFCAIVNGIAGLGIALMLPEKEQAESMSFRKQLGIFRKVPLWINIGASTFIFAAMFSVYSYSAEYLSQAFGLGGEVISILLVVFGIGGVAGNLLAGNLISRNKLKTTFLHPLALGIAYFLLMWDISSMLLIVVIMIYWGAAHTSGLIVTQIWLTDEAPEAPEFATALYISFINLGVTIGSVTGGWFLSMFGIHGTLWSGFCYLVAALVCIGLRIHLVRREYREKTVKPVHPTVR